MTVVISVISDGPAANEVAEFSILRAAVYRADGKMIRFQEGAWMLYWISPFGAFPMGPPFDTLGDAMAAGGGGFVMENLPCTTLAG